MGEFEEKLGGWLGRFVALEISRSQFMQTNGLFILFVVGILVLCWFVWEFDRKKGATFAEESAAKPQAVPTPMLRRVLLVDDEVAVLLTMKAILEISGFDVDTAASARDGKLKLRSHEYDMIITDMRMENDAAGAEMIRAARSAGNHPAVALLTAYPVDEEDWQQMGAHKLLLKPVHTRTLLEQIEHLFVSREKRLAGLKIALPNGPVVKVAAKKGSRSLLDIQKMKVKLPLATRVPLVVSIVGLTVAAFGILPYDFYVLLRVLIFLTAIGVIVPLWNGRRDTIWFWVMVTVALVYNPLLPIHLHRATWELTNVATIPFLGVLCFLMAPNQKI